MLHSNKHHIPAEAKDEIVRQTTALTQNEDDSDPFTNLRRRQIRAWEQQSSHTRRHRLIVLQTAKQHNYPVLRMREWG